MPYQYDTGTGILGKQFIRIRLTIGSVISWNIANVIALELTATTVWTQVSERQAADRPQLGAEVRVPVRRVPGPKAGGSAPGQDSHVPLHTLSSCWAPGIVQLFCIKPRTHFEVPYLTVGTIIYCIVNVLNGICRQGCGDGATQFVRSGSRYTDRSAPAPAPARKGVQTRFLQDRKIVTKTLKYQY